MHRASLASCVLTRTQRCQQTLSKMPLHLFEGLYHDFDDVRATEHVPSRYTLLAAYCIVYAQRVTPTEKCCTTKVINAGDLSVIPVYMSSESHIERLLRRMPLGQQT
jgi:hypothetical protein